MESICWCGWRGGGMGWMESICWCGWRGGGMKSMRCVDERAMRDEKR